MARRVGIHRQLDQPVRTGQQKAQDVSQEGRADAGLSSAGAQGSSEPRAADRSRLVQTHLPTEGEPVRPEAGQGELNAQREADRITITQFAPPPCS